LWWAHLSVCLSARISLEPRARSLPILLCMLPVVVAWSSSGKWQNPKGTGQFWGFPSPLSMHCNVFAAKGIIRSLITSCSRRDHSVAATFAANGISWEGGDGSAQCMRSVIYDSIVVVILTVRCGGTVGINQCAVWDKHGDHRTKSVRSQRNCSTWLSVAKYQEELRGGLKNRAVLRQY